jgi:hypothetical protein
MIRVKFKNNGEVMLGTMLNLRGLDSFSMNDEEITVELLKLIHEEIQRHRPGPYGYSGSITVTEISPGEE